MNFEGRPGHVGVNKGATLETGLFLFQDTRAFTVLVGKIDLEEAGRTGNGGKID